MTQAPPWRWSLISGCVALAVRLGMLTKPLPLRDQLLVPDDTYYSLSIARSLAEGLGPTADGVVLTSGFQPLWVFLLTPVFWTTPSPDTGLFAAQLLGALCGAASAMLLSRLVARCGGGETGAAATGLLWALLVLPVVNDLGGLEAPLALLCSVTLLLATARLDLVEHRTRPAVVVGVLSGLCLLARVDTVFLLVALLVIAGAQRRWREVGTAAASAVMIVAPWWVYCIVRFGSPIPESGGAVREQTLVHQTEYLTAPSQLAAAAGVLVTAPAADGDAVREWLWQHAGAGSVAWLLIAALLGAAAVFGRGLAPVVRAFAAFGLAVLAFYSLYLPAVWFFDRYLHPVLAALAVLLGIGLGRCLEMQTRYARHLRFIGVGACVAVTSPGLSELGFYRADDDFAGRRNYVRGYRKPALELLDLLPPDAVVASMQSGALGYYRPDGVRVINADGVVNGESGEAFARGELFDYLAAEGVTHFTDWKWNLELLLARGGPPCAMRAIGRASAQGDERYALFVLDCTTRLPSLEDATSTSAAP